MHSYLRTNRRVNICGNTNFFDVNVATLILSGLYISLYNHFKICSKKYFCQDDISSNIYDRLTYRFWAKRVFESKNYNFFHHLKYNYHISKTIYNIIVLLYWSLFGFVLKIINTLSFTFCYENNLPVN